MTAPVLAFFNSEGGAGNTWLVYHLAWMFAKLDHQVLAVDLDPQANLTAALFDEKPLEELWDDADLRSGKTSYQCIQPLTEAGDILEPRLRPIADGLHVLPGDLALARFEDYLSAEWPNCLGRNPRHAFRIITAFWQVIRMGAKRCKAEIVLVDVGPSLGAINRSALIAADFVVVPVTADLFSRQGLRNLGPTLRDWRTGWEQRREHWRAPAFDLPPGTMRPLGYLIHRHGTRLSRPVDAYDRWTGQMPEEYARNVLGQTPSSSPVHLEENCIATVRHYRGLIPLGQSARKPVFDLSAGEGAIGSHAVAARDAFRDFQRLTEEILRRMQMSSSPQDS